MNLTFLGTGSAFAMKNWQTNIAVTNNKKTLLIDCGSDIRFSMKDSGFKLSDIDAIYISHLHADHIGGLEFINKIFGDKEN